MDFEKRNIIWKIIGERNFCSFKYITPIKNYCRNEKNLTGFCSKQSCPLSNLKYATIIEKEGKYFLIKKVPEKSQFPNKLWLKIPLSRNYVKASQQVDLYLAFWPKFFIFKTKQKLTKIHQIIVRKKIKLLTLKKYIYDIHEINDYKKMKNEKLCLNEIFEKYIEQELLNRLHSGVYGKIYKRFPIQAIRTRKYQKKINSKNITLNKNSFGNLNRIVKLETLSV